MPAVCNVESIAGTGSTTSAVQGAVEDFSEYPVHEVASIFPMMSDADLTKLADDIKENGLREPIWVHEGKIIDGRNRYRACRLAGIEPSFRNWPGNGSLVAFVLSLNLHRRHLTDQQRALVAARAKAGLEAEALVRRNANLLQNKGSTERLDPTFRSDGNAADRAAAMLGVSVDATKKAAKVLKAGAPELIAAVEQEAVSLDAASAVSKLPRQQQKKLVDDGMVKEAAAQMRRAKATVEPKAGAPQPTPEPQESPTPPTADAGSFDSILAAFPEERRQAARTLMKTTIRLVKECPAAAPDDADLALRGLTALVERTRAFLKGGNDGHFLRGPEES